MIDKKAQGKKNRRTGATFELKVRKELESKGWIVAKWTNNVDILLNDGLGIFRAKLIPAKRKYNPFMKALSIGNGFPDFIVYCIDSGLDMEEGNPGKVFKIKYLENPYPPRITFLIGVEAKSNGRLDKEEKEKCRWLLENKIFSKILIAGKIEKGIEYIEFK